MRDRKIDMIASYIFWAYIILAFLTTEIHVYYGESKLFLPPDIYFMALLLPTPAVLTVSMILTYYLSRTLKVITSEIKKRFEYLKQFFEYIAFNTVIIMLGWGYLYITQDPLGSIDLLVIKLRVFILFSIYVYYALAYASYWLLRFSIEISGKKSKHIGIINLILLVLTMTLATHPANYYGRYPPINRFNLKPITALSVVLYMILSAAYGGFVIIGKIKAEPDLIKRFRLKLLNSGFILLIVSFISYTVYAILLSSGIYNIAMWFVVISSSSLVMSMISLYIGLNTPQLVLDFIRKKHSKS